MLQSLASFFRKKPKPSGGGVSTVDTEELAVKSPDVAGVLDEIDRALANADRISDRIKKEGIKETPKDSCFCPR